MNTSDMPPEEFWAHDDIPALVRAVAANPEDDLPKLVFADRVEELGGTFDTLHALFIRRAVADMGHGHWPERLMERLY